ncbi:MAG: tRNA(fMet)-specific endonuclease VapC [Thermoanaerobaculia bacterium]|jgi:tRNA(fMet)-specific endonuclease VapC|nr:tRNA(fMet)-specific endonuclease VapC [Thermoanaerobaculia bacterium]
MRLSLDTNVYTALFRGDQTIADYVKRADHVHLSAVVAGELLFGFRNGSRYEANRRGLEDFLLSAYVSLLPVTLVTADRFGRIATSLRRKGRPIPSNDIWIAAHAMESGSELLTHDQHFKEVDGLAWVQP